MSCGKEAHGSGAGQADLENAVGQMEARFFEFVKSATAPGALDERTKRAITIALSVLSRCDACAKSSIQKAREMGFSQEQIDEAAWIAVAFGGTPSMTFYKTVRRAKGG